MADSDRALLRSVPGLARVPHFGFGTYPTPVEELHLSDAAPSFRGRAWVKREDLSAAAVGGNKVRKLEYLFGEARARGADSFVTIGGLASNQCLAAAYHGRAIGLDAHLVLFPQHLTEATRRRFRATCAIASTLTYVRWANLTPVAALAVRARLARRGKRPYSIPPGATSMTGILGSAEVGLELAEQSHAGELEMPDAVFTALGSGGTAAGLALGLQLGGLAPDVVGVRVYPLPVSSQAWVRLLARRGHRRITRLAGNATHDFDASRITVRAGYLGAGYAAPTESGSAAEAVGKELGVPLDSTYTAKAFAAFMDAAKSPPYRDKNLVFLASYDPRLPSSM